MILFKEDWAKYPTAIADVNTDNRSFVRMAGLLKSMGVENHLFHLALMQPELQGVDPYDEDLPDDVKAKILIECVYNYFYFLREVIRVPGSVPLPPFRLNRGILSFYWCFLQSIDYSLMMIRQTGKSFGSDIPKIWMTFLKAYKYQIFIFTKDSTLRRSNILRLKDIRDSLPKWMIQHTKKDADNFETITCKARGNVINTAVAQSNKKSAEKVGRGERIDMSHTDEHLFIENAHISVPAMLRATAEARDAAKLKNIIHGNLFTSTAGPIDTPHGKYMHKFINSGMPWTEKLYDCANTEEVIEVIKNAAGGRILVNGTFNHRQIGRSDEWLKRRILMSGGNRESIEMDYFNKSQTGNSNHPIRKPILDAVVLSEKEPLYIEIDVNKYTTRWYVEQDRLDSYLKNNATVIGLDTSEGIGRDSNSMVISDIMTMEVIGVNDISEANLHNYALWLARFLIVYSKSILVIENKSTGQAILDIITAKLIEADIDPFTRIYNRVVDDKELRPDDFKEISKPLHKRSIDSSVQFKSDFGFKTSGSRRSFLYSTVLTEAAESVGHLVKDTTLISQIVGLTQKNGRVDHGPDGNDDLVIAWLLCNWFMRYTKNLSHYGISPRDALSKVSDKGAVLTEEEISERVKQNMLREEINMIKDKLIATTELLTIVRLERSLYELVEQSNHLGGPTLSMDSILNEIKEKKVTKRQLLRSTANRNK